MLGLLALLFLTGMQKSGALRDGEAPVFYSIMPSGVFSGLFNNAGLNQ